jgi:hypothetical protein
LLVKRARMQGSRALAAAIVVPVNMTARNAST